MSQESPPSTKKRNIENLQAEVDSRVKRNISLFKQRFPAIFTRIENHQATKVVLNVDPNGNLNLVDTEIREYFYHGEPKTICKKQVAEFGSSAKVRKFRMEKSPEYNPRHLHIKHLNDLIDEYRRTPVKRLAGTPLTITNLIVSGVGAGYHLLELIEQFDIHNIFIYENCLDTFHCSLHTVDWQPILDYFRASHRSITFCLGVAPDKALEQIEQSINQIGLHNLIFNFVYRHTQRESEKDFINVFMSQMQSYLGGLGYFDDEQIGFAHGVANAQAGHAAFVSEKTFRRKTPLMIVANGPSLDLHQDYIKRNRENTIIMSCGTALGSLLRMGIKPDFHVEMERAAVVREFMDFGSAEADRTGITLLCLHTVSPKTTSAFETTCFAIKTNDAGAPFVHQYFHPKKLAELVFCNPTVANCALSFSVSMGFMKIHLVGVDLGIQEDGKHHSSQSVYYDIEDQVEDKKDFAFNYQSDSNIYCEGNFGGQVKSHGVLNMSRVSVNRLLDIVTKAFPGFECINSNRGAKLKHTLSIPIEDLPDLPEVNKELEIEHLKKNHFYHRNSTSPRTPDPRDILNYFFSLKDKIFLNPDITSEKALLDDMRRIYRLISKKNDTTTNQLLRGSINCFFGAIIEHSLYCAIPAETQSRIQIGVKRFNQFMENVFERMELEPLRLDDTSSALISKIDRSKNK